MALFQLSRARRLFSPAPLQSFYPDSAMFHLPAAGHAPRPYQGLDMRKVHDYPWINVWKTRQKMQGGYQYANWGGPSVHAMTAEEVATFFTCKDYQKQYTLKQMLQSAWHPLRFVVMFLGCVALPLVPTLSFIFYLQRFEPMETRMDPEEYYANYRWHYYGPDIDHHAFTQYLEARRAKKWRGEDIDPKDWIPPQYRDDLKHQNDKPQH